MADGPTIDYVNINTITPIQFHKQYLQLNKPVILHSVDTASLHVKQNWTQPATDAGNDQATVDDYVKLTNGQLQSLTFAEALQLLQSSRHKPLHTPTAPNIRYIQQAYSDEVIDVTVCDDIMDSDVIYNEPRVEQTTVKQYLTDYISVQQHQQHTAYHKYWKDWHITQCSTADAQWPHIEHVSSNWLHDYYSNQPDSTSKTSDFRFSYFGPCGTHTPLHTDVYSSYSWSLQLCGVKLWCMIEKQYIQLCYDNNNKLTTSILHILLHPDQYPHYAELAEYVIMMVQRGDELVFVPSNMYHSVYNLTDSLSINENWCTGYNIQHINEYIKQSYSDALNECVKWKTHDDNSVVQLMMQQNVGMSYVQYMEFILYSVSNEIAATMKCVDIADDTERAHMTDYHTTSLRKLRFILHELSLKTWWSTEQLSTIKAAFVNIGDTLDSDNSHQRYKQIYNSRQL